MREPEAVIAGPDGRPALSLSEAARAAGVSRSTIRRRHESGAFTTAFKDEDGIWRIPHEELLVGVRSETVSNGQSSSAHERDNELERHAHELERRTHELEEQLSMAQERFRMAERLAEERARSLEDLRYALRALGGRENAVSVPNVVDVVDQAPEPVSVAALATAEPVSTSREPVRTPARRRRSFREWLSGADLPA